MRPGSWAPAAKRSLVIGRKLLSQRRRNVTKRRGMW